MAQLTAMQELIHDYKHGKFNKLTNAQIDKELERYLAKEKKQIENAYDCGFFGIVIDGKPCTSGGRYYNETYKK